MGIDSRNHEFLPGLRRGLGLGIGILIPLIIGGLIAGPPNNFRPGDLVSSSQINANFTALDGDISAVDTRVTTVESNLLAPVGSIVAWHKDLDPGVPAIPAGWLECDGQTVADTDSPLDGVTLPDLNGGRYFLRGSSGSGVFQGDQFASHTHNFLTSRNMGQAHNPAHGYCGFHMTDRLNNCSGWFGDAPLTITGGPLGHPIHHTGGADGETRPDNMTIVWIMRVK